MKSVYTRSTCFTGIGAAFFFFYRSFASILWFVCCVFRHLRAPWSPGRTNRSVSCPDPPLSLFNQRSCPKKNQPRSTSLVKLQVLWSTGGTQFAFGEWSHTLVPEILVLLPVPGDVSVHSYLLQCWSISLGVVASFIMHCPSYMRTKVE